MKFQPIPQITLKCDQENGAPEICLECYYHPNTHPKSTCQISECYHCLYSKNCVSFFSFLYRLWIFQVIVLIWANTGQFISSETSHKERGKCVYLSFHQSLVFQSNIVAFNIWCRGLFLYYLLFSEIKQVNFTKTMRDLLNTENLSQVTQQSADVSEPIVIIFTSF